MSIDEFTAQGVPDPEMLAAAAQEMWSLAKGHPFAGELPSALQAIPGDDLLVGQSLQLAVLDLWREAGQEVGGWKIAFTSRSARDSMGEGYRPFGYVLKSRILQSGGAVDVSKIPVCKVEPEVMVVMGADLAGPDVTVAEARAAVAAVAPAFEINSVRISNKSSFALRVGNATNNWGIVVGPEHDPDLDIAAQSVELYADGTLMGSANAGPTTLDDPYLSLTRVCRSMHNSGIGLKAGQRVITGSLLAATSAEGVQRFEAKWGSFGEVSINFV